MHEYPGVWEEVDVLSPFFYRMPNVYKALSWWGSPGKRHISSEGGGGCHALQDEKHELFLNFFFFSLKITFLKQNEKASEGKFTTWGNRLTARSLLGQGGCVASVAVCGTVRECPSPGLNGMTEAHFPSVMSMAL